MCTDPVVAGGYVVDGFGVGILAGETIANLDDCCVSAQR